MNPYSNAVIERIRNNLFSTPAEMKKNGLTEFEQNRVLHIREMYNHWLAYPTTRERDILDEMQRRFNIQREVAYRYLAVLRILLSHLGQTNKDFIRWQFNEKIMNAYEMALRDHNAEAMIKALDKYAKYNNLDKADVLENQWEQIMPQQFVMTDDPSVIGFKPIPNIREKIKAKINQYWNEQIEDVRFDEMDSKKYINSFQRKEDE